MILDNEERGRGEALVQAPLEGQSVPAPSLLACGDVEANPGPLAGAVRSLVGSLDRSLNPGQVVGMSAGAPQNEAGPQRRRRRRQGKVSKNSSNVNNNIQSTSQNVPGKARRRRRPRRGTADSGGLPVYSQGWLVRNLDPCGEYRTTLDYGKIPDGTLAQSVSGQFREVFTIKAPGQDPMSVPLEGGMWSLYGMHLNTWRHSFMFVADMLRPEVGDAAVQSAIELLNNVQDLATVTLPEWSLTAMDGVYVTVVAWSALEGVAPPSEVGVSPYISQFRITGEGFSMTHNTPSLINQGIVVCAQFPPNQDLRTINTDSEAGVTQTRFSITKGNALVGATSLISYTLPGLGAYPWNGQVGITVPTSGASSNSSVIGTPDHTFTSSGSSGGSYVEGSPLRFAMTNTNGVLTLNLQQQVGGVWGNVGPPFVLAGSPTQNTTITGEGTIDTEESHTRRVNVVTLPPVTQEDLIQETPKTIQFLLKEENGIYAPKRIWQPVFNMTPASSYAPLRFVSLDSTQEALNDANGFFNDTLDTNFGITVLNFTSLPLAAAPYFKVIRSWEAIPARRSPWGPFTTGTPPKDDLALVVAKTVSDEDPFAYPVDYNGLGLLWAKIKVGIRLIPKMVRTATNVANAVSEAVQTAQTGVSEIATATRSGRARREALVVE